jgi:hypothetical protein
MLTRLRCPACSQLEVTLADTGEFCCCACGECGKASHDTGRVLWLRRAGSHPMYRKPPAKAETIPTLPAS